jgi:lambda repressor-like predicted transcriptional regulator
MTRAEAQAKAIESHRKAKENLKSLHRDLIAELWKAGLSQKAIAQKVGVCRETVQRPLGGVCTKEERIARQKQGMAHRSYAWTPEMDRELIELRRQGTSFEKCGKRIGVTKNAACKRMRELMVGPGK